MMNSPVIPGRTSQFYSHDVALLVGIPEPIGFESPGSWLSRAALSQGVSPREIMAHFGFRQSVDPDMFMTKEVAQRLLAACQLPSEKFDFAVHMFSNLKSIDPSGENFLLIEKHTAVYRYCPVCLHLSKTKHFMVHWRFKAWRYCPLHHCLMDESCLQCGALVQLPVNLLSAGPEKKGVAFLDICRVCGHKLSSHWDKVAETVNEPSVSERKWSQLTNGRATLAAIYYGELKYECGTSSGRANLINFLSENDGHKVGLWMAGLTRDFEDKDADVASVADPLNPQISNQESSS